MKFSQCLILINFSFFYIQAHNDTNLSELQKKAASLLQPGISIVWQNQERDIQQASVPELIKVYIPPREQPQKELSPQQNNLPTQAIPTPQNQVPIKQNNVQPQVVNFPFHADHPNNAELYVDKPIGHVRQFDRHVQQSQASVNKVYMQQDPLWQLYNAQGKIPDEIGELLRLRLLYANFLYSVFPVVRNPIFLQTLFEHMPCDAEKIMHNTHSGAGVLSRKILYDTLQTLVHTHPECFSERGILQEFVSDPYVKHQLQGKITDIDLQVLVNFCLLLRTYDFMGIQEIASNCLKSATQACYNTGFEKDYYRKIAYAERDILLHAKPEELAKIPGTYTYISNQNIIEDHEYAYQYFQQQNFGENPYKEKRIQAFFKTKSENYKTLGLPFIISSSLEKLAHDVGVYIPGFRYLLGTSLEHEMMYELIEQMDMMVILHEHFANNNGVQECIKNNLAWAELSNKYLRAGKISNAALIIDFIHSRSRLTIAISSGLLQACLAIPQLAQFLGHGIYTLSCDTQARVQFIDLTHAVIMQTLSFVGDVFINQQQALKKIQQGCATGLDIIKYMKEAWKYATPEEKIKFTAEQVGFLLHLPLKSMQALAGLMQSLETSTFLSQVSPYILEGIESEAFISKPILEKSKFLAPPATVFLPGPKQFIEMIEVAPGEISLLTEASKISGPLQPYTSYMAETSAQVRNTATQLITKWELVDTCPLLDTVPLQKLLTKGSYRSKLALQTSPFIYQQCLHENNAGAVIEEAMPRAIEIFEQKLVHNVFPAQLQLLSLVNQNFKLSHVQARKIVEHIYFIDVKAGRGNNLLRVHGFHHNLNGMIQDTEIIKFRRINEGPLGFYTCEIFTITPFGTSVSYKTFFPDSWTPEQVAEFCIQHFKQAKIDPLDLQDLLKRNPKTILTHPPVVLEVHVTENLYMKYIFNPVTQTLDTMHAELK